MGDLNDWDRPELEWCSDLRCPYQMIWVYGEKRHQTNDLHKAFIESLGSHLVNLEYGRGPDHLVPPRALFLKIEDRRRAQREARLRLVRYLIVLWLVVCGAGIAATVYAMVR